MAGDNIFFGIKRTFLRIYK